MSFQNGNGGWNNGGQQQGGWGNQQQGTVPQGNGGGYQNQQWNPQAAGFVEGPPYQEGEFPDVNEVTMAGQVYPNQYLPHGWEFKPSDRGGGGMVTANIKLRHVYNNNVKHTFIKIIAWGDVANALRNELQPGRLIRFTGQFRENGYVSKRDNKTKRVNQIVLGSLNGQPAYTMGPVLRLVDEMPPRRNQQGGGGWNNGGQQGNGGWNQQQTPQGAPPQGGPPQGQWTQPPQGGPPQGQWGQQQAPQGGPPQGNWQPQQNQQPPQGNWQPPQGGPPQGGPAQPAPWSQPPQQAPQQPAQQAMPGQGGWPTGGQFAPPQGGPPQGAPQGGQFPPQ